MMRRDYYVISRLLDALFGTEETLDGLIGAETGLVDLDDKYNEFINEIDMLIDEAIELRKKIDALIEKIREATINEQ